MNDDPGDDVFTVDSPAGAGDTVDAPDSGSGSVSPDLGPTSTWRQGPSIIPPDYERSTLIDCAYGGAAPGSRFRDGEPSDLRMTVLVPGRARRCGSTPHTFSTWCDTEPEADGTIGPIRIYIAERPTLATTLMGFGLRQGMDEIHRAATVGGFSCSNESGTLLHCQSGHDRIDVVLKDGRSVAIRWLLPRDKPGHGGEYDRTVYRFGLNRDLGHSAEIWQEPKSPVRVTFSGDTDPMVFSLEDTAGLAQESSAHHNSLHASESP